MSSDSKMEAGSKVRLNSVQGEFDGLIILDSNREVVLRLENGYQARFLRDEIKSITVLKGASTSGREKTTKNPSKEQRPIPGMPIISILHAGGTIASRVDYETGAVKAKFSPEEILEMVPELSEIGNIRSRLVRNMMSDDMRFAHYNLLADEIKREVESGVNGIIITQGTDTMHYTAAALSFALENLPVPVIIVGSQRSSDRGSSDAALNLISAAYFIAKSDFAGVAICMHHSTNDDECAILPGCKSRKLHTSRRDAFRAVNSSPIAIVNYKEKKVEFIPETYSKRNAERNLRVLHFKENLKIAIVKAHPNMHAEEIERFSDYDGIVLEGTGLGHMPITKSDEFTAEGEKIFRAIELVAKNSVVVMSSQTIFGRVDMNVYSPGRRLIAAGVLGNYSDMTPETTFIKLAWLLSNYTKDEIKEKNLIIKNFRGEISERTPIERDGQEWL